MTLVICHLPCSLKAYADVLGVKANLATTAAANFMAMHETCTNITTKVMTAILLVLTRQRADKAGISPQTQPALTFRSSSMYLQGVGHGS